MTPLRCGGAGTPCDFRARSIDSADNDQVDNLGQAPLAAGQGEFDLAMRADAVTVPALRHGRTGGGVRGAVSRARPLIPQRRGKPGVQGGRSVPFARPQCSALRRLAPRP